MGRRMYTAEQIINKLREAEFLVCSSPCLADLLHQLDTGNFKKTGKTTLAEYLERWLKDYAWPSLAPRTAEGYESIIRSQLIPGLGNMQLTQL